MLVTIFLLPLSLSHLEFDNVIVFFYLYIFFSTDIEMERGNKNGFGGLGL